MNEVKRIILAAEYEQRTNWLKAVDTLLKATKKFPNESLLYKELGSLYAKKNLINKATEFFKKAFELNKRNEDITFKLAYSLLLNKKYPEAIEYFELISDLVPEAAYNQATALYLTDNKNAALECLEKMIASFGISEKSALLLAKLYLEFQRYNQAITIINTTIKLLGENADLLFIRAASHSGMNKWLKAYIDFQQMEKYSFKSPNYSRMYAIACEKIGKTDKAIAMLSDTIDEYPNFTIAYFDLIRIYKANKQYYEALKMMDLLYQKTGNHNGLLNELDDFEVGKNCNEKRD